MGIMSEPCHQCGNKHKQKRRFEYNILPLYIKHYIKIPKHKGIPILLCTKCRQKFHLGQK